MTFVRPFLESDWPAVWGMLQDVFRKGETYPHPPETSEAEARKAWIEAPTATYVAQGEDGAVLGTYYIKPNQPGLGSHVCNCGYIVGEKARRQGVATLMGEHSQQEGLRLGFRAMQFNLVVSTNEDSFRLWKKMGFQVIGALPGAFRHSRFGFVDAYVMFKTLSDSPVQAGSGKRARR